MRQARSPSDALHAYVPTRAPYFDAWRNAMAPQSNARVTQQEPVGTTSRIPLRIANLPIHRSTGLIELSDQYEILSVNETIQQLAGITGGRHSLQDLLGKDAGRSVE